jgi:DNA invertase Pin-like site-specific DNA recombinase
VYTRKSSEEGLEQSFNSLDAQREACRAFINSQKHEGWLSVRTNYDDGGYSGATMERPSLKRLMEDIQAKKVDTVVVYKVDRLTRSLADFAKLVEIFDRHQVSFVSVTQQFNTTTSMGRLTLNVLLSFAQFEREVTGERIRDKIAASKRKGMWMGGTVPLGYDIKCRKLTVNESEAKCVRDIFRLYLRLGCVSKLKTCLEKRGVKSKQRVSQSGRKTGGVTYSRGALYRILQNRIYLGEIEHQGHIYAGEHQPVVPRKLWEEVQARLKSNNRAHRDGARAAMPSLLVGLIFDEDGNRFTPAHAVKNGKRYRYYVSQFAIKNPGSSHASRSRIPGAEVETLVISKLKDFLGSPHAVLDALSARKEKAAITRTIVANAKDWSKRIDSVAAAETRTLIRRLVSRIVVCTESVDILIGKLALRQTLLGNSSSQRTPTLDPAGKTNLTLNCAAHLERCGCEVRFVLPPNSTENRPGRPIPSLIKAIARARNWYDQIVSGERSSCRSIAQAERLDERYVSRILQFAFLAPDMVKTILDGRQHAHLSLENFRVHLPIAWAAQRQLPVFPCET